MVVSVIAGGGGLATVTAIERECGVRKLHAASKTVWADERGITAIEYAVLAGVLAAALVAVFGTHDGGVLGELAPHIRDAVNHTAVSGPGAGG